MKKCVWGPSINKRSTRAGLPWGLCSKLVKHQSCQWNSGRLRKGLDDLDLRSTLGRIDAPSSPSQTGGETERTDGGEQKGRK